MACHHPDKSCDNNHCYSGNIMFLICLVTFREYMFKVLCEFMGGNYSC